MTSPYRIVVAPRADADLLRIIGQAGPAMPLHVERSVQELFGAFESLRSAPHRQVVHPQPADHRPPVRSLPVLPYMVYFRVFEAERVVRITRVRHGSRRPLMRFD